MRRWLVMGSLGMVVSAASLWAAGPPVPVKVGETVTLSNGMAMREFHSKSLDRTFPVIYFVGAITTGAGAPSGASGMEAMPAGHGTAKPAATTAVAAVEPIEGGQTVEQIMTGAADWSGKDVVIRGQVVKFNGGIMGANWIHLQDGTGSAGTNDLTVTTDAIVAVGDIVVVRGAVATDRDFGSGYSYAVMIENAAVTKE